MIDESGDGGGHRAGGVGRIGAIVSVFLGAASYGVLSSIVKLGYREGFSTPEIMGSQALAGCLALWAFGLPQRIRSGAVSSSDILKLAFSGVFTGLTGILYYLSLNTLDASVAVLLLFQFTWMGMLLDWVLHGRAPTRNEWIAVGLILGGTAFASGALQGGASRPDAKGVLFGLSAALSYTLFMYASGRVATHVPALLRSAWMVTGATVLVFVLFPPVFLVDGALARGLWRWGALLGVFGMVLPAYLYAKGMPRLETALAAIIGAVELPVVIVVSAWLLGEHAGLSKWAGVALILLGIVVAQFRPARAASTEPLSAPAPL